MSTATNFPSVDTLLKPELCPNCGREWPHRFGDHHCNFSRRYIHNNSIIIEPGAELLESVKRLADRLEDETTREAQGCDLAGEEPPYPRVLGDIDAAIGYLKEYREQIQRLAGHSHKWNEDDYCSICGADGRA